MQLSGGQLLAAGWTAATLYNLPKANWQSNPSSSAKTVAQRVMAFLFSELADLPLDHGLVIKISKSENDKKDMVLIKEIVLLPKWKRLQLGEINKNCGFHIFLRFLKSKLFTILTIYVIM